MQLDPVSARMVSSCLLRLRMRSPFFATLALFARIEASTHIPTAATDGRDVFINEQFFQALTSLEQDGLLLHEILHAALLHVSRRGSREPRIFNIAADIVINGMIAREGGFALPAGGVRKSKLEHLSVEEVYDLLIQDAALQPDPQWFDLLDRPPEDAEKPGQASPAAVESHWRHAYQRARLVAESSGIGDLAAGWNREFGVLDRPQLDWRSYLWRYLVRTPVDFTDFDRRFVGRRMYLETLSGESVHIHVAVDTSGSVDDRQLTTFVSEVGGILSAYPHLRCDLYYVDVEVHGPYPLTTAGPIPRAVGGGGTDFRPFFAHVEAGLDPVVSTVLVYLTDGEGVFPSTPPRTPVLWVVTAGGRDLLAFPFGETTRLLESK
jgi:predicted metal-dependent peptidase